MASPGRSRLDPRGARLVEPERKPAIRAVVRVLTAALISGGALLLAQGAAHAGVHRAALVIEHGAGWSGTRVLFRCVQFAQDAVSGLALLELAGANSGQPPQVYDWGGGAETVCQLDHEPRTIPDRCFGPTSGPNWSDWSLTSSGWTQRSSGAGGYVVRDGDVEGWTYTSGFGAPPPAMRFSQACPPVAAAPVATGPTTHPPVAGAAPASRAQPAATAAMIATPTPTPTAVLQAIGPTTSATARMALAETGTAKSPSATIPVAPLALIVVATASLISLAVINLRRRAP